MVITNRVRLETVMQIETGSKNTENKIDGAKYPFFVRSQVVERIADYSYDCEAVLTAGDGVGTGKVFHYINGKFDAHQRVYVMSQFNGIDGKYFYYYFSRYFFDEVAKYTAKSSVDSVRRAMIADMEIPLPPLPEQRLIAETLSDTDALLSSLEKLIDKKRAIKQGALQELLTGKRRLEGFAREWIEKKVEDIANVYDNLRVPITASLRKSGKTPYYGANGIQDFVEGYTHKGDFVLLAEDGANDLANYPVSYVSGEIWVNNHAHVIQGITSIADTRFLAYAMRLVDFQSVLVGGTRAKLNGSVLRNIEVLMPIDIDEQTSIASILSDMDSELDALAYKLTKLRNIKQGMMSELLTGRIRLTEEV